MRIIVGTPVYNRLYVIPMWLASLKRQTIKIEIIALDSCSTDGTTQFLQREGVRVYQYGDGKEETWDRREKSWNVELMVDKRNRLLDIACELNPDLFLETDCDLLFPANCIEKLVKDLDTVDIVSPLIYVVNNISNVMTLEGRLAVRKNYPIGSFFPVDIIMGAILQTPRVYQSVRHSYHEQGDSVGWGINAKAKGFQPWCDSRVECFHFWKQMETGR